MADSAEIIPFSPHEEDEFVRPLPSNVECEQAVLGSIFCNSATYHQVSGFLRAEHFFEPVHRRIYSAIEDTMARGEKLSASLFKPTFDRDPLFKDVGGGSYLARLASSVVTIFMAPDQAREVVQCWRRRELCRLADRLIDDACAKRLGETTGELIAPIEEGFLSLAEEATEKGPQGAGQGVTEALGAAEAVYKAGGKSLGLATGLTDLDRLLGGLYPGDFDVIAGRTSMGKSAAAASIALHVASERKPVLFWSGEMQRAQIGSRLLAMRTGISTERQRRGPLSALDMDDLIEAERWLNMLPLFIDDTVHATVADIRSRAIRMQRGKGLALVVVDYLQLLVAGRSENRVQEISKITRDLKALAMHIGVPIIALSQLSRAVESRDDKRPQLSDLRKVRIDRTGRRCCDVLLPRALLPQSRRTQTKGGGGGRKVGSPLGHLGKSLHGDRRSGGNSDPQEPKWPNRFREMPFRRRAVAV